MVSTSSTWVKRGVPCGFKKGDQSKAWLVWMLATLEVNGQVASDKAAQWGGCQRGAFGSGPECPAGVS